MMQHENTISMITLAPVSDVELISLL